MRLWVLFVLLAAARSKGASSEDPAKQKIYTTSPSIVPEEIQPKFSLLEYETSRNNKSAVIGETTSANVSLLAKWLETTVQKIKEFSKGDEDNRLSSLPEGDNTLHLTMDEIPKPTAKAEANEKEKHVELQPHDEEEPLLQTEEFKQPSTVDKPLNSQFQGDMRELTNGETPLAGDEETLIKSKEENKFINKDPLEEEGGYDDDDDEEEEEDDDDLKAMKHLSRGQVSLVKNEEMVKLQTEELKIMSSPSQAVWTEKERENASNNFMDPKIYEQNETAVQANEIGKDLVSILQLKNENKPQKDEKYTMFIFEEKSDDEMSESQEDDNTWFIFEEDEGDEFEDEEDAASESQEESDEDLWLPFEGDEEYHPDQQINSTVLNAERIYEENRLLENTGDHVMVDPNEGYGEHSNHAINYAKSLDIEDISYHETQNENFPKQEYLSSHFYAYLAATAAVVFVLYAVYHNNGKIIAFITRRRSGGVWSASNANYHSLHNKV